MQITQQSDDWRLPLNNTTSGFSNAPSLGSTSVHSSLNAPLSGAAKRGPPASFHEPQLSHQPAPQVAGAASGPPTGLPLEPSAVSLAPSTMQQQQSRRAGLLQGGMGAENDGKLEIQAALQEMVRSQLYCVVHSTRMCPTRLVLAVFGGCNASKSEVSGSTCHV